MKAAHVGLLWMAVAVFWYAVTSAHHPARTLHLLATALLVGGAAAAVGIHRRVLLPRARQPGRWGEAALALAATVGVLAVLVAFTIRLAYDQFWGPDPRRYGPDVNIAMGAGFITLHLLAAALLARLLHRGDR